METVITTPATTVSVQILNPKEFATKEDYAVAMGFAKEIGWTEICETLGLPLDPKGGRRTLYNAFKAQANNTNEGEGKIEKSVAVKVPASTITVIDPVVETGPTEVVETIAEVETVETVNEQPVDVKKERRQRNAKVEPVTEPVVTDEENETDEIQAAAQMFAAALAKMKGKNVQIDPSKIQDSINEAVAGKFTEICNLMDTHVANTEETLLKATEKLVADKLQSMGVTRIEIKVGDKDAKKITGKTHKEFKNIVQHLAIRDHVMLVGPAGSGKTTVCAQAAEALELEFYCKSVCAQTSKAELLGYMDANGNYITTEFRKAYENGGLFVLDEVDAGNPNVISVLNSALANDLCAFADKMVRKSEDFVLVACGNTFGMGADRQYVGRNQLDAATLDRFSVIEFGYDESLERDLAPCKWFCNFTQKLRKELISERVVISPRATILGGKLIKAGFSPEYALKTRVLKGMPAPLTERVMKVFNTFYNEKAAKGLEEPNQPK